MLPIPNPKNEKIISEKEEKLLRAIKEGLVAEECKTLFGKILSEMEAGVFKDFSAINPLARDPANPETYVKLSIKLRVIQDIIAELGIIASNGRRAQSDQAKQNGGS